MLKISKSWFPRISPSTLSLQELLSELIKSEQPDVDLCYGVNRVMVEWQTNKVEQNFGHGKPPKIYGVLQQVFHNILLLPLCSPSSSLTSSDLCRPNIGPNNLASKEHLPPQRRNIRSVEYFSIWLSDQNKREVGVAVLENTGGVKVSWKFPWEVIQSGKGKKFKSVFGKLFMQPLNIQNISSVKSYLPSLH